MSIPTLVSSSFCAPHSTQFEVRKNACWNPNNYNITDNVGNLIFKVKAEGCFLSPMNRIIYDAASGEALLVLRKGMPCCGEMSWVAFRGDGKSESEVLFTLRKSPAWCSPRVSFEVFLGENNDSTSPDFSMESGSWRSKYSVLFNGTPIAEGKKTGWGMVFTVHVNAGVDQAFIAALSTIWIHERVQYHTRTQTIM